MKYNPDFYDNPPEMVHDIKVLDAANLSDYWRKATTAAAWVRQEVATLSEPKDDEAARVQARELLRLVAAEGWLEDVLLAEEPNKLCARTNILDSCLYREALAWASPLADDIFAIQCLAWQPIAMAAGQSRQQELLPGIVAGETMLAFAMTETEAGSDVAAIKTRARSDGDSWVLDGEKTLISNAGIADLYVVFASTEPAAGHRGLSCFLVPADTPGLRFVGPQILSAAHPLGTIAFEGCRVPHQALLEVAGQGFTLGMKTLDRLRVTVAAAACGMAARALEEAIKHARKRRQFGKPLADFQMTQQKLARMATELKAARWLTYQAASEVDYITDSVADPERWEDGGYSEETEANDTEEATLASAMAKSFATEAAQRVVDDAIQIIGGRGVLADHPVDRLYRSVRALRIYEGATEIQHIVIARQLLRAAAARDESR